MKISLLVLFVVVCCLLIRLFQKQLEGKPQPPIETLTQGVQTRTEDKQIRQSPVLNSISERSSANYNGPVLFGSDIHLTKQMIEIAQMTDGEAKQIDVKLNALWADLGTLLAKNAKRDELRSDGDQNISAFLVPPFYDQAFLLIEKFHEETRQLLGSRSDVVSNAFPSFGYFGNFGRNEIKIKFIGKEDDGDVAIVAETEEADQTTGRILLRTKGSFSAFQRKYGFGFRIPK